MNRDDLEWSDIVIRGVDDADDDARRTAETIVKATRQLSIFDALDAEALRDYLRKANT